ERRAHSQLLMAPFSPDEHEVGDVGACDEQDDGDAPHEHPEKLAHVADDVAHEGADFGSQARLLKQGDAEALWGWEAGPHGWDHACDVRIGGIEGLTGAETGDAFVAELPQRDLV